MKKKKAIIRRGFLIKQGGSIKTWKKRFFTLDEENLSYYESKSGAPKGVIPLASIGEARMNADGLFYGALFEVVTPGRIYMCRAPMPSDAQGWVHDITHTLAVRSGAGSGTGSGSVSGSGPVVAVGGSATAGSSEAESHIRRMTLVAPKGAPWSDEELQKVLHEVSSGSGEGDSGSGSAADKREEMVDRLADAGRPLSAKQVKLVVSGASGSGSPPKSTWLVDLYPIVHDKDHYEAEVVALLVDDFEKGMVMDQLKCL